MTRQEKENRLAELLEHFWQTEKNVYHIVFWKYKGLDLDNAATLSDADLDMVLQDLEKTNKSLLK